MEENKSRGIIQTVIFIIQMEDHRDQKQIMSLIKESMAIRRRQFVVNNTKRKKKSKRGCRNDLPERL